MATLAARPDGRSADLPQECAGIIARKFESGDSNTETSNRPATASKPPGRGNLTAHHPGATNLDGFRAVSARGKVICALDIQKKIRVSLPVTPRMSDMTLRPLVAAADPTMTAARRNT